MGDAKIGAPPPAGELPRLTPSTCLDTTAAAMGFPHTDRVVSDVLAGRACGVVAVGVARSAARPCAAGLQPLEAILRGLYERMAMAWVSQPSVTLQAVGISPPGVLIDLNSSHVVGLKDAETEHTTATAAPSSSPATPHLVHTRRCALPSWEDAEAKLAALAGRVDDAGGCDRKPQTHAGATARPQAASLEGVAHVLMAITLDIPPTALTPSPNGTGAATTVTGRLVYLTQVRGRERPSDGTAAPTTGTEGAGGSGKCLLHRYLKGNLAGDGVASYAWVPTAGATAAGTGGAAEDSTAAAAAAPNDVWLDAATPAAARLVRYLEGVGRGGDAEVPGVRVHVDPAAPAHPAAPAAGMHGPAGAEVPPPAVDTDAPAAATGGAGGCGAHEGDARKLKCAGDAGDDSAGDAAGGKGTVLQQFQLRASNARLQAKVEELTACLEEERRLKTAAESCQWALSKQVDVLQRECDALKQARAKSLPQGDAASAACTSTTREASPATDALVPNGAAPHVKTLSDDALHPYRANGVGENGGDAAGRGGAPLEGHGGNATPPSTHVGPFSESIEERRRKLSKLFGHREPRHGIRRPTGGTAKKRAAAAATTPTLTRKDSIASTGSVVSACSSMTLPQGDLVGARLAALEKTAKDQRAYILDLEKTLETSEVFAEQQQAALRTELEASLAAKTEEIQAAADTAARAAKEDADARIAAAEASCEMLKGIVGELEVSFVDEKREAAERHAVEAAGLREKAARVEETLSAEREAFTVQKEEILERISGLEEELKAMLGKAEEDQAAWASERGRWAAERQGLHVVSDKLAKDSQLAVSEAAKLRKAMDAAAKDVARCQQELESSRAEVAALKRAHDEAIARLSAELDVEHSREIDALDAEHADAMQRAAEKYMQEKEELEQTYADPKGLVQVLREQVAQLKDQAAGYKKQLNRERQEKAILVAKREEAEHRLSMSMSIAARTL